SALAINADAVDGSKRGSDALRKAMRALSTLVQSVAEARNSIGDGHGSVNESPATPRHARLVFNSTVAVAQFIADTWHETSHEQKAALGSSISRFSTPTRKLNSTALPHSNRAA